MRILAIFDETGIDVYLNSLRKLKHYIEVATSYEEARQLLTTRSFEVILCQPYFAKADLTAVDILKKIRSSDMQSDIPFIGCETDESRISIPEAHSAIAADIEKLGGQGYIQPEIFKSKNLGHHVARCMNKAVGATCVTMSMF
jgi:hypothetical protein